MKCSICKTDLKYDGKRQCRYCPVCHPQPDDMARSIEDEIAYHERCIAGLKAQLSPPVKVENVESPVNELKEDEVLDVKKMKGKK